MPFLEFSVLCGSTLTGIPAKIFDLKRFLACDFRATSIRSKPERSFFTDFGSPESPTIAFEMANGDKDVIGLSLSVEQTVKKCGHDGELLWWSESLSVSCSMCRRLGPFFVSIYI